MSETKTVKCRWCGCDVVIVIPEEEFARKFLLSGELRCGCNSCVDYHRQRHAIVNTLQEQALFLTRKVGESKLGEARYSIRASVAKMIQLAEEHYLVPDLMKDAGEFATAVEDNPENATIMANMFERGVRDLAKEIHGA